MKCPFCSYEDTKVIDSRSQEDNSVIRRRRLCEKCGKRFTTYERIDTIPLTVIKKDNTREQFDKSIEDFSAGQKKKVLLSKSLCQKAHLYIWDEPLNFIDVLSRIQIETLLLEYQPTMIFVEHDAAFTQKIATKFVTITAPKNEENL